jgi:septum formation inhibitor MinC
MDVSEGLEAQRLEAEKQIQQVDESGGKKPLVLDGEDIPEAFRGKSAKAMIDELLNTSLEVEKLKKLTAERDAELASLRATPKSQVNEDEEKVKRERDFLKKAVNWNHGLPPLEMLFSL